MKYFFATLLLISVYGVYSAVPDPSLVTGYHFHTYFFQDNPVSYKSALNFRRQTHEQSVNGTLKGCRLNHFNTVPRGPHPIGSFETCCNASTFANGMSWFMKNRGNHSVLIHPLTRYEVVDHTRDVLFLGSPLFIDLTPLAEDIGEADKCLPIPWEDGKTPIPTWPANPTPFE
ncbi:uncharacterized protein LOC128958482 [Oppia nitens]|uniref:uncharacterized protein LOC128958482 n=1 Tax=Oppia nitens TaxID=1686743 RepID=UPI0023DCEA0C|nr:uncharacterized protein LOC128958482 [Oppia nitens]